MPEDPLLVIDEALIALRHLWTTPAHLHDPDLGTVDMSTLWVVDGLRRQSPDQEHTVSDLAAHMDVAHSTASRLVARAEDAGAIVRRPSANDRRRVAVELTPAGSRLAAAGLEFRLAILRHATHNWTPHEHQTFADLLARFARSAHTKGTP